jgi:hypothetical protein
MVTEISGVAVDPSTDGNGLSLSHALPSLESGWPPRPFQIVSLFAVLTFWADSFYDMTTVLNSYIGDLKLAVNQGRGQNRLDGTLQAHAQQVVHRVGVRCSPYELEQTRMRVEKAERVAASHTTTVEKMLWEMDEIEVAIRRDLSKSSFMFFPAESALYVDHHRTYNNLPPLLGADVAAKFPQASKEMSMAGTCYGTECHTACVFHLVRVVEIAARVMVSSLNVEKELKNMKGHRIPAKLATWEQLVTALQKGVDAKRDKVGTSIRRKETHEFYNHAVSQFRSFKDAWRNKVSHKRKTYGAGEAKDIMENVKQFMTHLAERLSEGRNTSFD